MCTRLDAILHAETFLLSLLAGADGFGRVVVARDNVDEAGLNDLDLLLLHLSKGMEFKVTSVGARLSHESDVLLKRLVVDKASEAVGLGSEVVACLLSKAAVVAGVAVELIGKSTEEAVAIACCVGSIQTHHLELCVELSLDLGRVIERVAGEA